MMVNNKPNKKEKNQDVNHNNNQDNTVKQGNPYNYKKNSRQTKEIEKDQKLKKYKYGDSFPILSKAKIKEKWKQTRHYRSLVLVIMQLRNNKYDMFTVSSSSGYFVYEKGMYMIDTDMVREETVTKLPALYYHQDCSLPFLIDFDLNKLSEAVNQQDDSVQKAINPYSLREFIMGDVIQQVIKGQAMADELYLMKILIIIVLIINSGIGILLLRTMGII